MAWESHGEPKIETRVEHDRAQPSCNGAHAAAAYTKMQHRDMLHAVMATTHHVPCREGGRRMLSNRGDAGVGFAIVAPAEEDMSDSFALPSDLLH